MKFFIIQHFIRVYTVCLDESKCSRTDMNHIFEILAYISLISLVKVFRINPEFRILRLTFNRKYVFYCQESLLFLKLKYSLKLSIYMKKSI